MLVIGIATKIIMTITNSEIYFRNIVLYPVRIKICQASKVVKSLMNKTIIYTA